jgi:hypothetical protein
VRMRLVRSKAPAFNFLGIISDASCCVANSNNRRLREKANNLLFVGGFGITLSIVFCTTATHKQHPKFP